MKLFSLFIFAFFSLLFVFPLQAQEVVRCATVEYNKNRKEELSFLRQQDGNHNMDWQKMQIQTEASSSQNRTSAIIIIPVVVHVVWNTASQNISDAKIISQITALNKDFTKTNTDISQVPTVWQPLAANPQIQFCMASRKSNGDWTNGIERRQTSMTSYTLGGVDSVKYSAFGGLDAWDYTQYLNIWVLNFSNGILGVTQTPLSGPASTDGICVQYSAFGTVSPLLLHYNKGRTATHEIGHWLGLFHIWGDDNDCSGTDSISDTPNQELEHTNCPTFPSLDACSPVTPGTMFMNFMDYSWDPCLLMFTLQQSDKMNNVLSNIRGSLLTSLGCTPAIGIEEKELSRFIRCFPNPAGEALNLEIDFPIAQDILISLFDSMGKSCFETSYKSALREKIFIPSGSLRNGIYYLRCQVDGKAMSRKVVVSH